MSKIDPIRPVVLVTRATGRSGGSVLRRIRERGRFSVRAMSRTPDSAVGRALAGSGVQVVTGDLDDVEALRNAMAGCYGVVGYVGGDACGRSWQRALNLLDAGADAGIGYVVIGVCGCSGSTAGAEVARMEGYARSVGVPVAFVDCSRQVEDAGDAVAQAFEERVDAMLRA
ncbi:MAG TPA: NmrA family NAD(P)-binding protein [Longimicrobiales bacterium]|nr:NmrA family NAD(P)-binding protein [Longimicrobiales bacterium]